MQTCVDELREFSFEIVTKERIFKLAALAHADLVQWIKGILPSTSLHHENSIFLKAENEIQRVAKARAAAVELELLQDLTIDNSAAHETKESTREHAGND